MAASTIMQTQPERFTNQDQLKFNATLSIDLPNKHIDLSRKHKSSHINSMIRSKLASEQQQQQQQMTSTSESATAAATAAAFAFSQFSNLNSLGALAEAIQKQARDFSRRRDTQHLWPKQATDFSSWPTSVANSMGLLDFSIQRQEQQNSDTNHFETQQQQSGFMSNNQNRVPTLNQEQQSITSNQQLALLSLASNHNNGLIKIETMTQSQASCTPTTRKRRGARKCRKTYGMARRELWCTQCKWKKACSRFSLQLAATNRREGNNNLNNIHCSQSTLYANNGLDSELFVGDKTISSNTSLSLHRHQFHLMAAANCLAITSQAALSSALSSSCIGISSHRSSDQRQ